MSKPATTRYHPRKAQPVREQIDLPSPTPHTHRAKTEAWHGRVTGIGPTGLSGEGVKTEPHLPAHDFAKHGPAAGTAAGKPSTKPIKRK